MVVVSVDWTSLSALTAEVLKFNGEIGAGGWLQGEIGNLISLEGLHKEVHCRGIESKASNLMAIRTSMQ